jgi:uncharacterized protein YuzE
METILKPGAVRNVREAVPLLLGFPMERFWVDYDREADVLYISSRRPQQATDTQMTDDGILLRYRGADLVGITVLEASTRAQGLSTAITEPQPPVSHKRKRLAKKGH